MMKKNPYKGKFIVFDSLDGAGNSTQVKLLADYLNKIGEKTYITKEPTSGLIGGLIKSQLTGDWKSSQVCLQLLFSADRAYHLEKEVIPLLKRGINVISDRYFFSTMAYGNLEINDFDWLIEINKKFLLPDLTFFLKVSPKTCIQRIKKDRFEITLFEREKILEKVWQNYQKLSKRFKNVYIIDGEREIEKIFKEIKSIVEKFFLE
jgi:dTMP kinase